MATSYKTPGVYVEEIPKFPPSVAQVETAIPAFIGYTQKADKLAPGDLDLKPTRIKSLLEYERFYGTMASETVAVTIDDELLKDGTTTTLTSRKITAAIATPSKNITHYQMQMYFANGGGPCYMVSVGRPEANLDKAKLQKGIDAVKLFDEPTLIVIPESSSMSKSGDLYGLYNSALMQAAELKDRFVVMDINGNDLAGKTDVEVFRDKVTGGVDPAALKYGAAYYPFLKTIINYNYSEDAVTIAHNTVTKEKGKADANGKGSYDGLKMDDAKVAGTDVYALMKNEIAKYTVTLPPSAAVVGAYATIDSTRGVWKSPANISLNLVDAPSVNVSDKDQEELNVDTNAGKSINVIRSFTGQGIKVWGARTLAGNDNEWRYISVRRFFNMVEESVKKATNTFVFEPNDANTWVKVKAMVENFLILQWRAGALAGAKPEHAFYVAVGLNQTMDAQDILEGRMIVEIGMAAVRPAEFIILRFSHKMQES